MTTRDAEPDQITNSDIDNQPDFAMIADTLTEQFGGLQQGMASISRSLEAGLSQFGELTQRLAANANAAAPASERPPGTQLADETEPAENRITVVNRLPKAFTGVLREQFELMRAWLVPIHRATSAQSADMRNLQKRLEDSLKAYEALIGRIGSSTDQPPGRDQGRSD